MQEKQGKTGKIKKVEKNSKNLLTEKNVFDRIILAADERIHGEISKWS